MTKLYGHNPEKVIDLLKNRLDKHKKLFNEKPRKLALVVEGGGMRGVLSAGSLLAVDLLGFRNCFDEIYATSAGAVNAAYFVSGQGELGITVYFDYINNSKFFNPFRLTKILDVEYVYDYIVPHVKTLNEAAIRKSNTHLYLSVTDVETGRNRLIDTKTWPDPVSKILKASSALPILYNRTVELDGRKYIDGGASDVLPVRQAIDRGCTDILILLTKDKEHISDPPSQIEKLIYYLSMTRKYPHLMDSYESLHGLNNENRKLAIGEKTIDGVNIATICPAKSELIVSKITMNRAKLIEGAYTLAAKTFNFFSADMKKLDSVFERYRAKN
ncbi:MAG: patatin family protein [Nitrosomonas sp.]|nr:patatin family protein [Nitrosomonas sp.]